MGPNRRSFLKSSAAAISVFSVPAISYGRIMGANDQIRIGVIGLNGRGQDHMSGLKDYLVAVCDCDKNILGKRAEGKDVEKFTDYRKLCESKNIDAVSIATPNHLHSIIGIQAAQSGKDVYVEKPVSHNVWEGRQLASAASKYNRIIQCGTQSRSSQAIGEAVQYVQSGSLGKIHYAIGTCYKPRLSIGKLEKPLEIPSYINYDLWCGPAEKRDLFRPKLHYDWHWDFNTGNGDMGNQGIHQMDIARWFLGYGHLSPRILSIGGRLAYDDAGNTPNTQTVIHDYSPAPLIFETRGLPRAKAFQNPEKWGGNMDNYRGSRVGVLVQCENGYVVIPNYSMATAFDNDNQEIKKWQGATNHYNNFIEAVRSRDASILNAPIIEGHLSSGLCHTGGVSHRMGEKASLAEIEVKLENESPIFRDSFKRMADHLTANGVDISETRALTLGADLKMNPDTEQFVDNTRANQMLTRDYRPGFVVPDLSMQKAS